MTSMRSRKRGCKMVEIPKVRKTAFTLCLISFLFVRTSILFPPKNEYFESYQFSDDKSSRGAQIYENVPAEINLNKPITTRELNDAKESLSKAKEHVLTPLRAIDKEKFTVRINTWHRNDQLVVSVHHLISCPAIAQVQIVWCDQDNAPPLEILNLVESDENQVVVEYHSENSLNERFNILSNSPTLGILSIDDDLLRPCEAMDAGFFRWTDSPHRIVGFDARGHVVNNKSDASTKHENDLDTNPTWSYGHLSTTRKTNKYSLTLPRFCFLHRDYLYLYMHHLPGRIMQTVVQNFNCEDIAMSFFISALNHGQVPLLADSWAVATMLKLKSSNAISANRNHHRLRDNCVDRFGFLLGLKDGYTSLDREVENGTWGVLQPQTIRHKRSLGVEIGADPVKILSIRDGFIPRRVEMIKMLKSSRNKYKDLKQTLQTKISKLIEIDA